MAAPGFVILDPTVASGGRRSWSVMDYVLLSPEEVGTLLNVDRDEVVSLVELGELAGLKVAGHWRVPLKSITELLASGMKSQTRRALERVFSDPTTWNKVFGAHPEVTQQIAAGQFPVGSVGARLKEAIALSQGRIGALSAPGGQDPEYQSASRDDEAATG